MRFKGRPFSEPSWLGWTVASSEGKCQNCFDILFCGFYLFFCLPPPPSHSSLWNDPLLSPVLFHVPSLPTNFKPCVLHIPLDPPAPLTSLPGFSNPPLKNLRCTPDFCCCYFSQRCCRSLPYPLTPPALPFCPNLSPFLFQALSPVLHIFSLFFRQFGT